MMNMEIPTVSWKNLQQRCRYSNISPLRVKEKYLKGIQSACASYTAKGITSAQDGFTSQGDWEALKLAHSKGLLTTRVQILPGVVRIISISLIPPSPALH